jgi:peptidoglycan hydrolase-like protein with peptidoglycan-binding domain
MGRDKSWPGTFMKSLTILGKTALAGVLAAIIGLAGSAWAEGDHGDATLLLKRKNSQSSGSNFGTISNFSGSKGGKAVTKTEVFAGRSILPMVSPSSAQGMADAISRYEIIVSRGGWPQVGGSRLARASSGKEVATLRQRLAAEGYLPSETLGGENPQDYSETVMKAVAQFQANHGLAITGKVDRPTAQEMNVPAAQRLATLRANLSRMQEYSKGLGARYIIVNVPALQLEAVGFNSVFSRHNVIAGQPSRPTPVTITQISDINFNPYWNAPVSIVEKDIIPRVQHEGTRVLRDMNMRIYDGYNGPEVNPDDVDWYSVPPDRFFFRQDPGAENAMASVKINFPSPFGIYLHDTPTKNLFTAGERYLSSGCVRVEQVHVLVNWILNGQDGWNPARIEQVADSHERLDVKVTDPPQLRTVYLTAWAAGGGPANFRDDIYDLDGTGFVVGQPLAPGEYSDDGQRFVLKPIAREASASVDDGDYFKSRQKWQGFGLFRGLRGRTLTTRRVVSPRLLPNRRDEQVAVFGNFSTPPDSSSKKLGLAKKLGKQQAESKKKKKLLQPASGKTKTKLGNVTRSQEKGSAFVAKPKKPVPTPDVAAVPKKKKKKIEEAAATAAASPVPQPIIKPIFTQQ